MPNTDHPNGSTTCVTCGVYRPDSEPRRPERPPVCEGDRILMERHLSEVASMHRRLANPGPVEYDNRRYEAHFELWDDAAKTWVAHSEQRRADPLSAVGGVAPVRSRTKQPSVSGSRVAPIPISVDAADLTAKAHNGSSADPVKVHPDDQVGYQAVATILDQWARDWRDTMWADHNLPQPKVSTLARWLNDRLDRACNEHPAIDDFATELRALRFALRRALGETEPRPREIEGASCRRCELRNTLIVRPGDIYIECAECGLLSTEEEHRAWMSLDAGYQRSIRSAEEVADLLRSA